MAPFPDLIARIVAAKPRPVTPRPQTAPPPPPYPGYIPLEQRPQVAQQQAQEFYRPVLDYLREQQERARASASRNAEFERARAAALADVLKGVAPSIQGTYQEAAGAQSALARGFSDGLRMAAERSTGQANQLMDLVGSPQEQRLSNEPGVAAADVSYGLGGYIPASTFNREGAAFTSAAQLLPATTRQQGERQAFAALQEGTTQAGEIDDQIARLLADLPGKAQGLLSDIQKQQFGFQKFAADQEYRQDTLKAKPDKPPKVFGSGSSGYYTINPKTGKVVQLVAGKTTKAKPRIFGSSSSGYYALNPETGEVVQVVSGQPNVPAVKIVGSDKSGRYAFDPATGQMTELMPPINPKTGKKRVYTPKQLSDFHKDAGRYAQQSARGYWADPLDDTTPITLAEARKRADDAGLDFTKLVDALASKNKETAEKARQAIAEAGLGYFNRSYQESLIDLVNQGVPLNIARQALNRYWTKPGQHMKWEKTAKGFPSGAGRPKNPKARSGNRQIVLPLPTPLTAGSEFASADPEGAPARDGRRYHAAKDWFAPAGTPVISPVAGTVVEVKPTRGNSGQVYGGVVKVQMPDGPVFVFRHVDPRGVRRGQKVRAGVPLATVSAWTGGSPHAHIEVWRSLAGGYQYENMVDPTEVFV